jgi:hypothetical protein
MEEKKQVKLFYEFKINGNSMYVKTKNLKLYKFLYEMSLLDGPCELNIDINMNYDVLQTIFDIQLIDIKRLDRSKTMTKNGRIEKEYKAEYIKSLSTCDFVLSKNIINSRMFEDIALYSKDLMLLGDYLMSDYLVQLSLWRDCFNDIKFICECNRNLKVGWILDNMDVIFGPIKGTKAYADAKAQKVKLIRFMENRRQAYSSYFRATLSAKDVEAYFTET